MGKRSGEAMGGLGSLRLGFVVALWAVAGLVYGCSEDATTAQCVSDLDCERYTVCQASVCASVECLLDEDCGPGQFCAAAPSGDVVCTAIECDEEMACEED